MPGHPEHTPLSIMVHAFGMATNEVEAVRTAAVERCYANIPATFGLPGFFLLNSWMRHGRYATRG
jgi:hypothetical protein